MADIDCYPADKQEILDGFKPPAQHAATDNAPREKPLFTSRL
jgi:hypothetical protein